MSNVPTVDALAKIHNAAFIAERKWQAAEFTELLAHPYTNLIAEDGGFAIIRTLAGETELLTLAVAPEYQRQGIASRLVARWLAEAEADTAFLDVAADNFGAIALYTSLNFQQSGQRKGYYARTGGPTVDAILMTRALINTLTQG